MEHLVPYKLFQVDINIIWNISPYIMDMGEMDFRDGFEAKNISDEKSMYLEIYPSDSIERSH